MSVDPPRQALYARLIDYAGLFPPASLELADAIADYDRARRQPHAWMLGPFLLPSSRLTETIDVDDLGVVVDAAMPAAHPRVRQLEARLGADEAAGAVATLITHAPIIYVEGERSDPGAVLDVVAGARRGGDDVRAKIRTGGTTPEAIPGVDTVGDYIRRCVASGVPFKATAGLHHAVRSPTGPDDATEHGFLNLLAAVRVAVVGGAVETCLADEDPASFDPAAAVWKGIGAEVPAREVRSVFAGFGSCSFSEPVASLEALGGLAATASERA